MTHFIEVQNAEMVFTTRKGRFHALHDIQLRVAQLCTGLTARVLYHYQGQALWLLSFTGVSDDDSARAVLVAALQDWLGFFATHAPWDELCERYVLDGIITLVDAANDAGGRDNISVILAYARSRPVRKGLLSRMLGN